MDKMKSSKFIKKLALVLLSLKVFTSCSSDDNSYIAPQITPKTIAEIAVETPRLSTLVQALERMDLVSLLQDTGEYTVFAPTNDAFSTFLAANNFETLEEVPLELLENILFNHFQQI